MFAADYSSVPPQPLPRLSREEALLALRDQGQALRQSVEATERPEIRPYLFAAGEVAAKQWALLRAVLLVGERGELGDWGSAQAQAQLRTEALRQVGLDATHERPLMEAVRIWKYVGGSTAEWNESLWAALPLMWSRHGVSAQLAEDMRLLLPWWRLLAGELTLPDAATSIELTRVTAPHLHDTYTHAYERLSAGAKDDLLRTHDLHIDQVFALLNTPIGPERGRVAKLWHALIDNPEDPILDFGSHTETLRARARALQEPLRHLASIVL